jgi:hypothetical protein
MLADPLGDILGDVPLVVLGFVLMLGGPVALLAWFIHLVARGRRGPRDGMVFGIGVGGWASACWLLVPYCGAYACLPGLFLVHSILGFESKDLWTAELIIHWVNFTLWPFVGWVLFLIREAFRSRSPRAPESSR